MTQAAPKLRRKILILKSAAFLCAAAALVMIFTPQSAEPPSAALGIGSHILSGSDVEQEISEPNFSGVTQLGEALSITAHTARLLNAENRKRIDLDAPSLSLSPKGGQWFEAHAQKGRIDVEAQTAALEGAAEFKSEAGFRGETGQIEVDLALGLISSPGQVTLDARQGSITAGSMLIYQDHEQNAPVLLFQNGVKLVYTPAEPATEADMTPRQRETE